MITRRRWHLSALAVAASIVAGCGGGTTDAPLANRVIAFGDSLTDIGTYTPATSLTTTPGAAPYFGGKFTTNTFADYALPPPGTARPANTSTANIWVEWISARLGVAITPAEVGFGPVVVPCPAAASGLAATCSGYAQGGARVTDPNGIGKSSGALTVPIADQIALHNTRTVPGFKTGFDGGDIVFVFGGNNDVFVQLGLVGAAAITPADAIAAIQAAGTELATLVKNEILAKGASRVAVMTLPDASTTPAFLGADAQTKGLLTQLSAEFNTALLAGLAGSSAHIIDARALNAAVQASPSAFGLSNITMPACNATIISAITGGQVTDGSSLFCNASPGVPFNGLTPGASASTYLFADGVHPTTGGHKIFADQVWSKLKDFGWVPSNL
jgi:phospholipase/lecithinase/hemolysin